MTRTDPTKGATVIQGTEPAEQPTAATVLLNDYDTALIEARELSGDEYRDRHENLRRKVAERLALADIATGGEHFDFAGALIALKAGRHVTRTKWLDKGKYVTLQKGYPDGIPINENTAKATGLPQGEMCRFVPYLMLVAPDLGRREVDGGFVDDVLMPATLTPWTPNNLDVMADDWMIVPRAGQD